MTSFLAILGVAILVVVFLVRHQRARKDRLRHLPPGPKPLPLVGNIRDLPPDGSPEYEHWLPFKSLYGPISSITVFGQTMVVIQERRAAEDIMEAMSKKSSGRPDFTFGKLSGYDAFLSGKQYDASWRLQRKLMHQNMGTEKTAAQYKNIQHVESRRLLMRTLRDPQNLMQHLKTMTAAAILEITYGYTIEPCTTDPLLEVMEEMMIGFSTALTPLSWAVDLVPALRFLPLPFQRPARRLRFVNRSLTDETYAFVQRQMAGGAHKQSVASRLLTEYKQDIKSDSGLEDCIKSVLAFMYAAGADTSAASLSSFVLAMTLFPAVQLKAQEELDRVIGTQRLADLNDRQSLPYVSALVQEVLRWFPIVPINTTHAADADIHYRGYRIPKGSYLSISNYALLTDPQTYRDPSAFAPERFLEPRNEPDPATAAFGYGRRICPGRYLADGFIFVAVAHLLAMFRIQKAVGEDGQPLEPKIGFTPGLVAHPVDFAYDIVPRSEAHAERVRKLEEECPWEAGDARLIPGEVRRQWE